MSRYTSQILFRSVGTKVPATVRFSTVSGESGSADTSRDINGIAIKLKTEQGILDIACLNTPTFFIRDPAKYPDLVHITKRNPETNLKDPDMFWVISFFWTWQINLQTLTYSAGFFLPKPGDGSPNHDVLF